VTGTETIAAAVAAAFMTFFIVVRVLARPKLGKGMLEKRGPGPTLVVIAHGLLGKNPTKPLVDLVREAYPDADLLTFDYVFHPFSNADPWKLTTLLQLEIDDKFSAGNYQRIVLVGYSAGAGFLRKALVWASGYEDDRPAGRSQPQRWAGAVDRFVSVAGTNRGWSIDPRPRAMSLRNWLYLKFWLRLGALFGVGKLIRAIRRGEPFIADLRVQWIRFTRDGKSPFAVHILGDEDDVVDKDDSKDLGVTRATRFLTLANTNHANIIRDIDANGDVAARERRRKLLMALVTPQQEVVSDIVDDFERTDVTQVAFLMHGIRDYGGWANTLADRVLRIAGESPHVRCVHSGYGYFPMLPFLIYGDRQRNVRWFMDQYTEQLALYPKAADAIDFVGHSNGTYLLASSMLRYKTINIRNVLFAGSVVPRAFPWWKFFDSGQVKKVVNVAAAADWVVAWFPRLFEQIAEWMRRPTDSAPLDIGSAGFREFGASREGAQRVRNISFLPGGHGTAVDQTNEQKMEALSEFVLKGETHKLDQLERAPRASPFVDVMSNICWFVWLVGLAAIGALGYCAFVGLGWLGLIGYCLFVFLLLKSV
jgi:hypothetical protein